MTVDRPLIVGVAGGTGSGKTAVAAKLAAAMPPGRCAIIEYDCYYRDQSHRPVDERAKINYDHPDVLESELLAAHLQALRRGEGVDVPVYDYITHTRQPETFRVEPHPVIILEGIMTLAVSEIRSELDIKVYVDTDPDIRVLRRIRRDLEERGRAFSSVREQYYESVRPMHMEFVEPSKRWADLIVPEGAENRVAVEVLVARLLRDLV